MTRILCIVDNASFFSALIITVQVNLHTERPLQEMQKKEVRLRFQTLYNTATWTLFKIALLWLIQQ